MADDPHYAGLPPNMIRCLRCGEVMDERSSDALEYHGLLAGQENLRGNDGRYEKYRQCKPARVPRG